MEPLHGGWAAVGEGWTAYGQTKQEALQTFRLARKGGRRRRVSNRSNRRRLIQRWS
jgi:hypothetical protein